MSITFERPVGATADVKELEYIIALHQTSSVEKNDLTSALIESKDVQAYLMSRHGLKVSIPDIRRIILTGLGGTDTEDDGMDLCELVATLVIPTLVTVSTNSNEVRIASEFSTQWEYDDYLRVQSETQALQPPVEIIGDVLRCLLVEVTGSAEYPVLTKKLLRKIFAVYGEAKLLCDDGLVEEMMECVGDNGKLDNEAFARGLTSDVTLYGVEKEHRFSTHFDDVFEESSNDESSTAVTKYDVTTRFTFPQIDFMADTFGNRFHVMVVWLGLFVSYFCYMMNLETVEVCSGGGFGCGLANELVRWCKVIGVMVIVGTSFITLNNLGNNISSQNRIWEILIGTGAIVFLILGTRFVEVDFYFFKTGNTGDFVNENTSWILVGAAGVLIFFQICNLMMKLLPKERLNSSKRLATLFRSSTVMSEYRIKQSATLKVNQMIRNAYDLHVQNDAESSTRNLMDSLKNSKSQTNRESTKARALMNYTNNLEKVESCGGLFWAYKLFVSGRLQHQEGISLHVRLLSGVFVQFVGTIVILAFGIYYSQQFTKELFDDGIPPDGGCHAKFAPDDCYFPKMGDLHSGIAVCQNIEMIGDTCFNRTQNAASSDSLKYLCDLMITNSTLSLDDSILNDYIGQYQKTTESRAFTFDTDTENICQQPGIFVPYEGDDIYALTSDSTDKDFCLAKLNAWIPFPTYPNGFHEDLVWGGFIMAGGNFDFDGNKCTSYPQIKEMMLSRDQFLKDQFTADTEEDVNGADGDTDEDEQLDSEEETLEDTLMPKKWMVNVTATVAIVVAFTVAMGTCLVYIPSTISTVLKFRSGVIPSLRSSDFSKFRINVNQITTIFGAMVWGFLLTSIYTMFLVAGVVFLALHQITRPFVMTILQTVLALAITIIVKTIIVGLFEKVVYSGFYRKHPFSANLFSLSMECWNLAITSGLVLSRFVKFMMITALYVGRIDTPVLSSDLFLNLDTFPDMFRKDVLANEAHRHPYIERLGVMYMMKLRYGDQFSKPSGAIWRLLFVFVLMPWLRKYRILEGEDIDEEEYIEKLGTTHKEYPEDESRDIVVWKNSEESTKEGGTDRVAPMSRKTRYAIMSKDILNKEIDDLKSENESLKELNRKLNDELTIAGFSI